MTSPDDRIESLRALAEKKNKPLHWYGLAMELRAAGRSREALEVFQRVHGIDPGYVPAYFMRAQVHEELGEIEEARAALEKGIEAAVAADDDHAEREMRSMLDTLPV